MKGKEYRIKAEIGVTVTPEVLRDIIVTALEGGIGYWAGLDNTGKRFEEAPDDEPVSETAAGIVSGGGDVTLFDAEDEEETWQLNAERLLDGIRLFIESGAGISCIRDGKPDPCDIDSEAADAIIQYALFGEQVYA